MGNSGSHEGDYDEDDDYAEQFDGVETLGYRVLGVQPNSPGTIVILFSFRGSCRYIFSTILGQ